MYLLAERMNPELMQAIAAWNFVELLEGGYSRVAEFHYLHHGGGGAPYQPPEAMSLGMLAASEEAGMGLLLLPVLYQRGGFDRGAEARQARFLHRSLDEYGTLYERLSGACGVDQTLGVAPHSLRAVGPEALSFVFELAPERPLHIHIAEQPGEVEACESHYGARPVEWLLDHAELNARVCLVHATWRRGGALP